MWGVEDNAPRVGHRLPRVYIHGRIDLVLLKHLKLFHPLTPRLGIGRLKITETMYNTARTLGPWGPHVAKGGG